MCFHASSKKGDKEEEESGRNENDKKRYKGSKDDVDPYARDEL